MENIINSIVLGDCLEVMKKMDKNFIDLTVMDPPYNMAYTGRGLYNKFDLFANDNLDDKAHTRWFKDIIYNIYTLMKKDSALYVFIDFRNYARIYNIIKDYFSIKNCIVWDKESIGMGQSFRFQHEFIIYAEKGTPDLYFDKRNVSDIWRIKRVPEPYQHPTQKPIQLLELPIMFSSLRNDIVFDPFVGSGTTAIAAQRLGRKYIGIEIDEKYYNYAKEKIKQKPLF